MFVDDAYDDPEAAFLAAITAAMDQQPGVRWPDA